MSQVTRISAILLAVMVLTGCASLNSIHRTHDFKTGSAIIDAKQRAIIAREDLKNGVLVCAEPSPDAMSAYAAELAGKVGVPNKVAAEFVGSFHEGSSFVGLRTQSIQLLRDESYRLCEAHMNGFISKEEYSILLRRQQRITVALLAIEQLTGAIRPPNISINTKGVVELSKGVDELVLQKEYKNKQIAAKKKEKENVDSSSEGSAELIKSIDNEIAELEKSRDSLVKGIENGRSMLASGAATAVVIGGEAMSPRSDDHIQAIAGYVDKIVEYTQTDDLGQMCVAHMQRVDSGPLVDKCVSYLDTIVRQESARVKILDAYSSHIEKMKIKNVDDLGKLGNVTLPWQDIVKSAPLQKNMGEE